jgi:sec-independent protein translocase protein TatA
MSQIAFLPSIGPGEWVLVILIILLLFGASRIPQLARSLGKSMSEFKKGVREGQKEEAEADDEKKGDEDKTS